MIVAGFGFRTGASVESLRDALARAVSPEPPGLLATAAEKSGTAVFRSFARDLDLPVRPIPAAELARHATPTQTTASRDAHGTGSVAEAAALAAAGRGASLLGPRVVSGDRMATCALAKGDDR